MDAKYSMDVIFEIYNDRAGEKIVVGEDRDGLDLVEITLVGDDGKVYQAVAFTREQAPLVIEPIKRYLEWQKA